MPRALVTCRWKRRGCGSRLAVRLASGTGLPSKDLCPQCGEPGALRHLLVQARRRWPNRVWTVDEVLVQDGTASPLGPQRRVRASPRPRKSTVAVTGPRNGP